jgi:hypothetical protein
MINQDSRSEEKLLVDEVELLRQQVGVGAAATTSALVAQTQGGAVRKGAVVGRPRISRELLGLTRADPTSPFKFNLGGASMTAVVGSRADQAGGSNSPGHKCENQCLVVQCAEMLCRAETGMGALFRMCDYHAK